MSAILDQILEWSATRPLWQQDALRRLAETGSIDESTIESYANACLGGSEDGLDPLGPEHLRSARPEPVQVAATGIRDAENVNSLAAGQSLTFAPTGITLVYGDNASGKSGYARVLKAVTRTRASERVRNDIFADATLTPRATITYSVGDASESFVWSPGDAGPEELSRLSFFDHACADVYLSRETEVAFRPFGLGLFDELVSVCEGVRAHLEEMGREAGKRMAGLPDLDDSTEAGRFVLGLTAQTTDDEITKACTLSKEQEDRRAALTGLAAEVGQGAADREAERLLRLADRAERAKAVLDSARNTVSASALDNVVRLRDDAAAKREAARMARTTALTGARLGGVGDEAWRVMWEGARTYSQRDAYPDRDFPVVENGDCVLCQQPLDDDAARRLLGFEEFIQDTTQRAADDAAAAYEAVRTTMGSATIGNQATTDHVQDLVAEDAETARLIETYLAEANARLSALRGAVDGAGDPRSVGEAPEAPTARLDITIGGLRRRGNDLRARSGGDASDFTAELAELDARSRLRDAEGAVRAECDRLQRLGAINAARRAASTNAITARGAELTNAALTEVLMDRFSRETDRLGLEHVVLRTVGGRRGVLRYRTGFVGAVQDAPLPEVLSEGEQTALGMAGFLAEVWTDPGGSGVVFDDPVSSLDHERRDKVAERLVTLAKERQTIVFTHDVAFLLALKKHAVMHSVEVTERSVEKRQAKPGHCGEFHKFSAKLVKERLHELEEGIANIKERSNSMTAEEYRDATARWYRLLRQTWERAIEESLVGEILTRDDLQVHPTMVRTLVLFTAEDNRVLQHRYGRATELSEAHDESAVINSPAPNVGDLEDDLEAIRSWYKTITARRNLSEERVYELAAGAGD